jgi:DNA adenine methylase
LREELREESFYSLRNAAAFYAINRSSFSGATFSGGFSKRAAYARFTDSRLRDLKSFKEPNLMVKHAHFTESLSRHPNTFLYLDPPYLLGAQREKLYGDGGNTHEGFDHTELHRRLSQRSGWVLSYNDCEPIRDMYKDYEIQEAAWTYGMNKSKESSEILIIAR